VELSEYRVIQRRLAILRDDGCCVLCWKEKHKRIPFDDVHHVYGRSHKLNEKENYRNLLSLCRSCHQSLDAIRSVDSNFIWVAEVLEYANKFPINVLFEHQAV
jgi:hypothetical protein